MNELVDIGDGYFVEPEAGLVLRRIGWMGNMGYPKVKVPAGEKLEHRVIWEAVHGPVPPGMTINHINGRKNDNRIANLECVTQGDNHRHAYATGLRKVGGFCARKGTECATAKLTPEAVVEIRQAPKGTKELAARFGISIGHLHKVRRGEFW